MNSRSRSAALFLLLSTVIMSAQADNGEREFFASDISLESFLENAYPAFTFAIEPSFEDTLVSGIYRGSQDVILGILSSSYGFNYKITEDIVQILSPLTSNGDRQINLKAFEMPLVQFVSELSSIGRYSFEIDTSMDTIVSGHYSGSIIDVLDTLTFENEFLIHIESESVSILPIERSVSQVISLPDGFAESEWYQEIGNPVQRFGNSFMRSKTGGAVTLSGHPRFVANVSIRLYSAINEFKPKPVPVVAPDPAVIASIEAVAVAEVEEALPEPTATPESPRVQTKPKPPKRVDFFRRLESMPGFY